MLSFLFGLSVLSSPWRQAWGCNFKVVKTPVTASVRQLLLGSHPSSSFSSLGAQDHWGLSGVASWCLQCWMTSDTPSIHTVFSPSNWLSSLRTPILINSHTLHLGQSLSPCPFLGLQPRTLCTLDECADAGPHPQPDLFLRQGLTPYGRLAVNLSASYCPLPPPESS